MNAPDSPFDPESADEDGLVAVGGSLEPGLLLAAYRSGVFPWSSRPAATWWSPDPRAIFDLESYRPHRSVVRSIARAGWRFSVDRDFPGVMKACAAPAPGRRSTWITRDFHRAYAELHRMGHAHSIEVWDGEELAGGVYGVSIGGFFGGESMFHRRTDASKAAIAYLVSVLVAAGFSLLDAQVPTDHLQRIGAICISRGDYLARLRAALARDVTLAPRPPEPFDRP